MQINDKCGACGQCHEACSSNAIQIVKTSGYSSFVIDENKCCKCGECASVCPMDAIVD